MDNKKITISAAPRLAGMLLAFAFLLTGQMLFAQSKQVTGVVKMPPVKQLSVPVY